MNRPTWNYRCQEDHGDGNDEDREFWKHPEEVPEDDSDTDEEMDEM